MFAYRAKRLAVKFSSPPILFLEYTNCSGGVHVRAVKLKKLPKEINLDRLTKKVIRGFPGDLDPDTVSTQQVRSLLQEVIDRCSPQCTATQSANTNNSNNSCTTLRRSTSGGGTRHSSRNNEHGAKVVACSAGNAQAMSNPVQHVACAALGSPAATCNCDKSQQQQQCKQHHGQQQQQQQKQCSADSRLSAGRLACRQCVASGQHGNGLCKHWQQQHSADCEQLHQQQLQRVDAVAEGMGRWLDGSCSGSVAHQHHQQQQARGQGARLHRSSSSSSENQCSCACDSSAPCNAVKCSNSNALDEQSTAAAAGVVAASPITKGATSSAVAAAAGVEDGTESEGSGCLTLEPDFLTNGEVDLNKVSDYELRLAKSQMHAHFVQNQVQPGDATYVYDKQVEFAPKSEANDWDDDD